MSSSPQYRAYLEAEKTLNAGLIRAGLVRAPEELPRRMEERMGEMADFLKACGNPQKSFPAIHIAGTSGKGSVATAAAHGLKACGLRTGLHVSPYIQSATEKIWIDGQYVSAGEFADLVRWVQPLILPYCRPETSGSPHVMASIAIALEAFRRAEVEVAVIEASLGGRYDPTRLIEAVTTVVTAVGYDHVEVLGPTLEQIAHHKAGVFRREADAVTMASGTALSVLKAETEELGIPLRELATTGGTFLEKNPLLAEAVLESAARKLSFSLAPCLEEARRAMTAARLPARFEKMPEEKRLVYLDGAHNPQKIGEMLKCLEADQELKGRNLIVVLGVVGEHDAEEITALLAGRAHRVVATCPEVFERIVFPAEEVAAFARHHCALVESVPRPLAAFERARALAAPDDAILVTGSLFLTGNIRERWFPKEKVVLHRTSWPDDTEIRR